MALQLWGGGSHQPLPCGDTSLHPGLALQLCPEGCYLFPPLKPVKVMATTLSFALDMRGCSFPSGPPLCLALGATLSSFSFPSVLITSFSGVGEPQGHL
jgi:hypothetical protein